MSFAAVLQHSAEDCGAACLATVAKHYGRKIGISKVRAAVGTTSYGTTLLGLRRGAEVLGFKARQVKASEALVNQIEHAPLPAIIHWKGNHWAVLYGYKRSKIIVADPAVGIRKLTRQELLAAWGDRVMLLLEPDGTRFAEQDDEDIRGLGYFLKKCWPNGALLSEVTALNMVIGLLALAFPLTTQVLTDDVLVRRDADLLLTVVVAVLALNLFQAAMKFVQSILIGHFGQRLQLELILDFGSKLLRLPMSYFDRHRSGEVVSRLQDISRINSLIADAIFGLPSRTFVALVSLIVMFFYSWQLTIAALAAFAVVIAFNITFLPHMRQKLRTLIVEGTENQGFLVETFRGALVLKSGNATPQAWEEYQKNFGRITNLRWSLMKLALYRDTFSGLIASFTALGILWLGGRLVMDGTLSIGQLLAFYGMSLNFLGFMGGLVQLTDDFVGAKVVMERLAAVLDAPSEGKDDSSKPWAEISPQAPIKCVQVRFHHVGRTDLIHDFDHTFAGGKVTALIGPSGCGKTTLAKLLAGLYQLDSGNIRYGIYNQRDIPLDCLRQQVVLVPQDPQFWSRSILENFRFAHPDVHFDEIIRACEVTGADQFIAELPDKYQTVLGEFGSNLSGGQRQRLALARGLISNPPVLILDEATDSLDIRSEKKVLNNLISLRSDKTTILISHRLQVIARADWGVILDKGRIKHTAPVKDLIHKHFQSSEDPKLAQIVASAK